MSKKPVVMEANLSRHCDYSLQLNRWFMKPIGVWPLASTTSTFQRVLSLVLIAMCYSTIMLTVIPCILHVLLDDGNAYMKIRPLGPLSHWIVGGFNYTTLLLRGNDICICVEHMDIDWRTVTRTKDQETMVKNAKLGRYVAASCAIFMQGGILGCGFFMSTITEIVDVGNETRIVHVLPCPVYKELLNVDEIFINKMVLLLQLWCSFITNSSTVGIFSLAAVLAAHAYGQLNVLMVWINEFVHDAKKKKEDGKFKQLGVIVEHHLRVLDFITHIEDMLNGVCFLEVSRCVMSLCVMGYYILTEWDDGDMKTITLYGVIFMSMSFNAFIICYIGETLTEQWKKVGEVVYMTDWYYLPEKLILDLILIIARSSAVVHLTAGKVIRLSIYTFSDVMKSAFMYMNMLRQAT